MKSDDRTPLVSVFVATYNQQAYIRDCLEGILHQITDFDYEIIIVDDASTDDNPSIIREYANRYPDKIRPFLLNENYYRKGKNKFFEIFLTNARGKYVAFCEGDDFWTFDNKLQRQVDFLESHPDYSMCCHNFSIKNESSFHRRFKPFAISRNSNLSAEEIIVENMVQTATVVARIDKIESDSTLKQDIYNNLFNFTDIRFFLSYINSGKVYGFNGYWSTYRINDNGVTSLNLKTRVLNNHQLLDKICECYNHKYAYLKRHIDFHKQLDFWTLSRLQRQYMKAIYHLCQAFAGNPKLFLRTYFKRYFKFNRI